MFKTIFFTLLLVSFPWMCGGVWFRAQALVLTVALIGSVVVFWDRYRLGQAFRSQCAIPVILIPLCGIMILAVIQLQLKFDSSVESRMQHTAEPKDLVIPAEFAQVEGATAASVYPTQTRWRLAQCAALLFAFLLAGELYLQSERQRTLLWFLAINGIAITLFGITQMATWDGKLFGSIPLRFSGSPFGPFVSRNHAAAYLGVCLAASLGLATRSQPPEDDSKQSWTASLSDLLRSPSRLFGVFAIVTIMGGIIAASSRMGMLSMVICITSASVLASIKCRGWKPFLLTLVIMACGLGFSVWSGHLQRGIKEIKTLVKPGQELSSRTQHWLDSLQSVHDFPHVGSGLGTYRYVTRPYQQHESRDWHINADGQYVEWFVEGGWIGLVLIVAGIMVAAWGSVQLFLSDDHQDSAGTSIATFVAVLFVSLMGITDSSPINPAVLTSVFVMLGMTTANSTFSKHPVSSLSLAPAPELWLHQSMLVVVSLTALAAALELLRPAMTEHVRAQIPVSLPKSDMSLEETNTQIDQLHAALLVCPDDSAAQIDLGRLQIHRFQHLLSRSLLEENADLAPAKAWQLSHPHNLVPLLQQTSVTGALPPLGEITQAAMSAEVAYRSAIKSCPLPPPSVMYEWTLVRALLGENRDQIEEGLLKTIWLGPSVPQRLKSVQTISDELMFSNVRDLSTIRLQQISHTQDTMPD